MPGYQPSPSAPPAPSVPPALPAAGQVPAIPITVPVGPASAEAIYTGLVAQRRELQNQLERLSEQRSDISNDLRSTEITTADRTGLEARLKETDARISSVEGQLSQADLAVSKAAAVPGAIVERPPEPRNGPPEEITAIPIVFIIFVLGPLAVAFARRIWKRGATVVAPVPREVIDRLDQMAQAVESIAIETERIGEGQRFLTRVMSDQGRLAEGRLGAGVAQPIAVPVAEATEARRVDRV